MWWWTMWARPSCQSLRTLRKGGRLLTVGSSGGPEVKIDNRYVFYRHTSIIGSTMSHMQDFTHRHGPGYSRANSPRRSTAPTHLQDAAEAQRRLESGVQLRQDHAGDRLAACSSRLPWFEIVLTVVFLSATLYAAFSDAYNLPNRWFIRDDAYYYYKVAQNISEGHGSTFDGIHPTNGYHPLWLLICIPIFALARFDLILPLRILAIVDRPAAAGDIDPALSADPARRSRSRRRILAACFWAFNTYVLVFLYKTGVESSITIFLVLVLLYALYKLELTWRTSTDPRLRQIAGLGVLAALVAFGRLDLIFFSLIVGIWIVFRELADPLPAAAGHAGGDCLRRSSAFLGAARVRGVLRCRRTQSSSCCSPRLACKLPSSTSWDCTSRLQPGALGSIARPAARRHRRRQRVLAVDPAGRQRRSASSRPSRAPCCSWMRPSRLACS